MTSIPNSISTSSGGDNVIASASKVLLPFVAVLAAEFLHQIVRSIIAVFFTCRYLRYSK